jgi:hypothetical protein
MTAERFREPEGGPGLWRMPWLVRCPRCGEQAAMTDAQGTATLGCSRCGLVRTGPVELLADGLVSHRTASAVRWRRDRVPRSHWPRGTTETYELWLRRPCGGHVLWATNAEHLTYLQLYVAATLREGTHIPHQSLHHKLPTWMKTAKHREEVLRTIELLQERLTAA